jgi:4-hydroxy-tetrahydrodipicolinate synthase
VPGLRVKGILCALITPFREDEGADLGLLGEVVDAVIERGVHGLFVLGTTGEGPMLDAAERREVAESAVQRAAGRVSVVIHCGAADTKTASDLARHAADIGADAVAAVVPYFFRHGPAELEAHFRGIAQAAPSIPLYVYENPERAGYSAGVETVARLVDDVPNIVGVKDTGDTIGKITDYLSGSGRPIEVFVGNNSTILPALLLGAKGSVSAMANAVPELVVAVYERHREGDLDEARRLQFVLARLTAALGGVPFVAGVKHLMARRGLSTGLCRSPLRLLDQPQAAAVDQRVAQIEGTEPWLAPIDASVRGAVSPAPTGSP